MAEPTDPPMTTKLVRVRVAPLPAWIDLARYLGPFDWLRSEQANGACAEAQLSLHAAAGLAARLRGLGLDGSAVTVEISPPLARPQVRAARLHEARARRDTTPGFLRTGARASEAGRYSLTPEALALALAQEAAGRSVLDACCGSGGNALGFARAGARVTAIDISPERIAETEHNARLYQVTERLRCVLGDALREVPQRSADILFLDPPWGEDYDKRATTLSDFPLLAALLARPEQLAGYAEIWLKLPSSFATRSVPGAEVRAWFGEAAGDRQRVKFLQLKLVGPRLGR
jgi:hypothetical protein